MGCPEQDESTSLSVQLSSLVEAGQPGRVAVSGGAPCFRGSHPSNPAPRPLALPCLPWLTAIVDGPGGSPLFHPGRCRAGREGWRPRADPKGGGGGLGGTVGRQKLPPMAKQGGMEAASFCPQHHLALSRARTAPTLACHWAGAGHWSLLVIRVGPVPKGRGLDSRSKHCLFQSPWGTQWGGRRFKRFTR